jgi:branched-chain amino acid aminotransferase
VPTEEEYARGVSIKSSSVPVKKPFYANVKSCNYLPNVLMRKEAVDAGVDYTISLDEEGFLAEGAAENIAVVGKDRVLKLPVFSRILRGTTVSRGLELAQDLVKGNTIQAISFEDIPIAEAYSSDEILIFGTSFDVVAAVTFDGQPVGTGKPGPVFGYLHEHFQIDVRSNPALLTPVFDE